jgi:enediyne biosynthesis protein E4
MRRRAARSGLAGVALLALVGTGVSPDPRVPGVAVTLRPAGPSAMAQGLPFRFQALVRNTTQDPVTMTVVFSVAPEGIGHAVEADEWTVTVQPRATAGSIRSVVSSQWFAQEGTFTVQALSPGSAGPSIAFEVLPPEPQIPMFEDVTTDVGLATLLPMTGCAMWGAGAAWGGVDLDGRLDLYVPGQGSPAQLWMQDAAGHFADQAPLRGVTDEGSFGVGAVFADYDNDGDQDLYVVNREANRLYDNDGAGFFTDVTARAGVGDENVGPSASFGDYDGDGYLDLYVANHASCSDADWIEYLPDRLYHNEGDGTFTDVTALLGDEATMGAGFEATWFDMDHDNDQDLYLANDYLGSHPDENHLWRNDGDDGQGGWTFTDISASSHTDAAVNSMGVGVGDPDRDGDLDFAISNIGGNLFFRNVGGGVFRDEAGSVGVRRSTQFAGVRAVTWGLAFADLNLDGWEDLYVAAGALTGIEAQPNQVFVNRGDGVSFLDLSAPSGADDPQTSRGIALADYDRDGRVDVYVVDQLGWARLFRNVTPFGDQHWLEVDTVGSASNRDGCGARVSIVTADGEQVREVFCGSVGLAGGNDPTVHFGLAEATAITELTIEWPSGLVQTLSNVAPDQVLTVVEGQGLRANRPVGQPTRTG